MSEAILVAIIAGLTSGGISQLVIFLIQRKDKQKNDPLADMVRGLGHDRIIYLGQKYIDKKFVTRDEYENLHDYLFIPYKELGGNGTAEKIMREVGNLPIK